MKEGEQVWIVGKEQITTSELVRRVFLKHIGREPTNKVEVEAAWALIRYAEDPENFQADGPLINQVCMALRAEGPDSDQAAAKAVLLRLRKEAKGRVGGQDENASS